MSRKSDIVAGMGVAMSIVQGLMKEVEKRGGTDEDIHRLATPEGEGFLGEMADIIVAKRRPTYRVVVDYSLSLAEMIKLGKYDWTNSDITAGHFPVKGKGRQEKEVVLFHFNRTMTSEDVIAEMEKAGYRPALIEDLLAIGVSQPELQKQFSIICLGSVWRTPYGRCLVPYFRWHVVERKLYLDYFEDVWSEPCRFLVLRK